MRDLVLISYTPLDSSGGVPRWNRDMIKCFPDRHVRHYSWWDVANAHGVDPDSQHIPEWEKARILNNWLLRTNRIRSDDVVVADSFWAVGLEHLPYVISVQHGNWSHTTMQDVANGVPPEFPVHAVVQLNFRKVWQSSEKPMVAVSEFISEQMKIQWDFDSTVIGNGIDTGEFRPTERFISRMRPIIIHFTTTSNKGLDHIIELKNVMCDTADVWILDEAAEKLRMPKYEALAQADLVVHPSAHEGDSYAILETLACGVPLVCYDVGSMWDLGGWDGEFGPILRRDFRSPQLTAVTAVRMLSLPKQKLGQMRRNARSYAMTRCLNHFSAQWNDYVKRLERSL